MLIKDGTPTCECSAGMQLNVDICVDIDECLSSPCDSGAICSNEIGSYQCICQAGYQKLPTGFCDDINECERNPCPINSSCTNVPGSFYCTCNKGYTLSDQMTCEPDVPNCGAGLRGYRCTEDINECSEGINPCKTNQKCVNTWGSYFCECKAGYRETFAGGISQCIDVNECTTVPNICGYGKICRNYAGSYRCESQFTSSRITTISPNTSMNYQRNIAPMNSLISMYTPSGVYVGRPFSFAKIIKPTTTLPTRFKQTWEKPVQ